MYTDIKELKVLTNEEEKVMRENILKNREKEYATFNNKDIMSMEEIIEEIYAYRRETYK